MRLELPQKVTLVIVMLRFFSSAVKTKISLTMTNPVSIRGKKLVVFDLDGTLTESKSPMDAEMADRLGKLLERITVAIVSGGAFEQFECQLPALHLDDARSRRLFFFPTTGTRFFRYADGWRQVYADEMTVEERRKINDAFSQAFRDIDYRHPETLYGEVVEDRGTQVTFSALGQQAPLELKKQWKATQDRRPEIAAALAKYLPDFEIKIPGVTSIDVTRKGIDKAYAIDKIEEHLGFAVPEMVFVGDALYEGGNDNAVFKTGIDAIAVTGPSDTKALIAEWLNVLPRV